MQTIYAWMIDFYLEFFNATDPIPDYIIEAFNWASFVLMFLIIFIPFIMIYGVIKLIQNMGGRDYD